MKLSYIGAILIGLSTLMTSTLFAASIEAGKSKSALCAACHGVDGNSQNSEWPSLAGQNASYLFKQLKDFQSGKRANGLMQGMVAALNEKDMENIAAYFESQELKPVAFDASMIELGETIYRGGITETSVAACMSCHSPSGAGIKPAGFPALRGQHPDYLVVQLKSFRDGSRANDANKMMRDVAKRMTDEEIKAVAAYVAGIQ